MFLIEIFWRVILPVFVVITLGFLYARTNNVDTRPFTRLVWNVTGPCLAFASLAATTIPDEDFIRLFFFVVIVTLILWPITLVSAAWLRLDRATSSSFQLSVLFGNIVNYGFPMLLFAFGQGGVDRGVIIMVGNQVLLATMAVFIASRGTQDWRQSLRSIARVPLLYASLFGFIVNRTHIAIPHPIFDPIQLVGNANLMFMLLLLGMQLAQVKLADGRRALGVAVFLRLVVSTAIGAALATVMGMQGLTRQAAIAEMGTPTAVYASVIASEYNVGGSFAAAAIFVSTLASMVTLTIVLALLGVR